MNPKDARKMFSTVFAGKGGIGKIEGGDGSLVTITGVELRFRPSAGQYELHVTWHLAPVGHEDLDAPDAWFTFPKRFARLPVEYRRDTMA